MVDAEGLEDRRLGYLDAGGSLASESFSNFSHGGGLAIRAAD